MMISCTEKNEACGANTSIKASQKEQLDGTCTTAIYDVVLMPAISSSMQTGMLGREILIEGMKRPHVAVIDQFHRTHPAFSRP